MNIIWFTIGLMLLSGATAGLTIIVFLYIKKVHKLGVDTYLCAKNTNDVVWESHRRSTYTLLLTLQNSLGMVEHSIEVATKNENYEICARLNKVRTGLISDIAILEQEYKNKQSK